MKIKKYISIILMLSMALGLVTLTKADTPIIIKLDSVETENNQEFELNISLENNPGIAGFTMQIGFDNSIIKPISFTNKSNFTALTTIDSNDIDLNTINKIIINYDSINNINSDGIIGTFKFRAISNKVAATEIKWLLDDKMISVYNSALDDVPYTAVNSTISFKDFIALFNN